MDSDYHQTLAVENVSTDDVWDLVMWSIMFTDAQLVPDLELSAEARDLPPTLWRFLARYSLDRCLFVHSFFDEHCFDRFIRDLSCHPALRELLLHSAP